MRPVFVLIAMLAMGAAPPLDAAQPSRDAVARYARQLLADSYAADAPGAAVIVARGDRILFRGARGESDISPPRPLSAGDAFEIGSMTKQFTAAGVLKLAEAGRLSLDDPLSKYLADYPNGDSITLLELLNHTAGVKDYTETTGWAVAPARGDDLTTAQMIAGFAHQKPDFAPGADWRYDNSGYVLLGAVIEAVTGMSWHAYLDQALFQPLGLTHTGYGGDPAFAARLVHGYAMADGRLVPARPLSLTQAHAAGGLVSNVDDLLKWNRALHEGRVLKHASYLRMITPVGSAAAQHYGFGLFHETLHGADMLQHGGSIFGFNGYLLYLPRYRVTVAVLNNLEGETSRSNDAETVARRLAAYAIGKPYPDGKPIHVDPALLKSYEGVYRIDDNTTRVIRVVDGTLTSRRTGGEVYKLIPVAKDDFLYDGVLSRLTFSRDESGAVTGMRYFLDDEGDGQVALRSDAPLPAEHVAITLPRDALERVAGNYTAEGMALHVFLDGTKLQAQLNGQPAAEVFASSPNDFFLTVVDATLAFAPAQGTPRTVTLRQGSDVITFQRDP